MELRAEYTELAKAGFVFEHYFDKRAMTALVKRAGRPWALATHVYPRLLRNLSSIAAVGLAVSYSGVAYSSMRDWLKRGRAMDGEPVFLEFSENYTRAEDLLLVEVIADTRKAQKNGNWRAGFALAAMRRPEIFGRNQTVKVESG